MPNNTLRRPISDLSALELRDRARDCREMAGTAGGMVAYTGLLKLAARLDALADAREETPASV
jgi:hypothetical protein